MRRAAPRSRSPLAVALSRRRRPAQATRRGATAPYEDLDRGARHAHLAPARRRLPLPAAEGPDRPRPLQARRSPDSRAGRSASRAACATSPRYGRGAGARAPRRVSSAPRTRTAQVAAMPDSPLAPKAQEGAAAHAGPSRRRRRCPKTGDGVEQQLGALRRKLDAWGALVDALQGHAVRVPWRWSRRSGSSARPTRLVVDHRRDLEHGDETAEKALRFLIQKHADSKNLPVHVLRLGDLYADLAREYVAAHERPLAFDEDEFVGRADRALDTYHKVATWDGAKEKPEGAGALRRHGSVEERHAGALPVMRRSHSSSWLLPRRSPRARPRRRSARRGRARRRGARGARPRRRSPARSTATPAAPCATWRRSIASATPLGQRPTGLTDDIRLLAAGARADARRPPRSRCEDVLDERPRSAWSSALARHALEPRTTRPPPGRLLADDRHNRRANLVNEAIRPARACSPVPCSSPP